MFFLENERCEVSLCICFHWFFIFAAFVFVFMSSSIVMVLIILDVSFELRAPSEHTVCVHVPVPLIQQVAVWTHILASKQSSRPQV